MWSYLHRKAASQYGVMGATAIGLALSSAKYMEKIFVNVGIEFSKNASVQLWRERANNFGAQGRIDEVVDC
jgi:hypothetical protein